MENEKTSTINKSRWITILIGITVAVMAGFIFAEASAGKIADAGGRAMQQMR